MSPSPVWTPLLPAQLPRQAAAQRLLWSLAGTALAPVLGREVLFRGVLRLGLAKAAHRPFFGVPAACALACLGDDLLLELPPLAVDNRLADWVEGGHSRFHIENCFLGNGDWSTLASPLEKSAVVMEARELVARDMNFRVTRMYRSYLGHIRAGRPLRRNNVLLDRPELVDAYFEQYLRLFDSIRRNGLLRRSEAPPAHGARMLRRRWTELTEKEIGIAIGSAGELYRLPGGQHRTAIARALELPRMPVQVRLVHVDWVRRQMELSSAPPAPAIREGIARLRAHYH